MFKQIFVVMALTLVLAVGAQNEEPLCQTDGAYASLVRSGIEFDLLCKPLYPETIELERNESLSVIVDLESFKAFSGDDTVQFRIHFAIDHGRLEIQQLGSFGTQEVSDSGGSNLKDVEVRTDDDEFAIEITSQGLFRSAKFDIAVWPG